MLKKFEVRGNTTLNKLVVKGNTTLEKDVIIHGNLDVLGRSVKVLSERTLVSDSLVDLE